MSALRDVNAACNLIFEKARIDGIFIGKTVNEIKATMADGISELLGYNKEEANQLVVLWFEALKESWRLK